MPAFPNPQADRYRLIVARTHAAVLRMTYAEIDELARRLVSSHPMLATQLVQSIRANAAPKPVPPISIVTGGGGAG